MDLAEYYSAQMELLAHVSNVFEIWLGFTFAAVVAFHLGVDHLTKGLFRFAQVLYLLASLLFMLRYFALLTFMAQLSERIVEAGGEPLALPTSFGITVFALMISTFFAGTTMTVVYSNYRFRRRAT